MRTLLSCIALTCFIFALASAQTSVKKTTSGMILVEGGTFPMGSMAADDERPVHPVTLSSFLLDQKEVTVAEYQLFCNANPPRSMPTPPLWGWYADDPIVNVSWDDAMAYAQWVGKKLPTEAQWEYAARGGKFSGNGYRYSGSDSLGDVAWYVWNSGNHPHPVGTKAANQLGLFDMSGNVWEWCGDTYDASYYSSSPSTNPTGPAIPTGLRVNRGGSWNDIDSACRVSDRTANWQDSKTQSVGFRCAAVPPPAPPVPNLSSPPNGSAGIPYSVTLAWYASSGATSYRVQISDRAVFDTVAYDSSGITGTSLQVRWLSGATTYYWRVFASNLVSQSDPSTAWSYTTPAGPYLGSRIPIPGIVEAEFYDAGGEEITYSDSSARNEGVANGTWFRTSEGVDIERCQDPDGGGFNIGWTSGSEWTRYSVAVSKSGVYRMDARVASLVPFRFHLEMDGSPITGSLGNEGTGDWQNWITLSDTVTLPSGNHYLRLKLDQKPEGGYDGNYNYFGFTEIGVVPGTPTGLTANAISANQIDLSWTATSSDETGFRIERAPGGTTSFAEIDMVGANITNYQNKGLPPSTSYTYRVRSYNSSGFSGYSNTATAKTQDKSIVVNMPQAGASWTVGSQQQVTWTGQNVTGNVTIKLSTDGGSTFPISLGTAGANAQTATITVPNTPSTTCRIGVESVDDASIYGVSPGNFTISLPQGITVTAPASGASWTVGAQPQVIWTSQNVTGNVTILLSTDGGSSYSITLGSALASTGSATVTVPNNPSASCRVKVVSVSNGAVFGINPGNFTIAIPPGITVTAPVAGASWTVGAQQTVAWLSQGVTGDVSILLSTDGGSTFPIFLATTDVTIGTATVTVPNNPGATCRIGVQSATNMAAYGLNPGDFSIVEPAAKVIAVTSPPAGANWTVGSQQQVLWTVQNVTGNVTIKLSADGGSSFPVALATVPADAGTAIVTVPNTISSSCRIKVELSSDAAVYGLNPGNFSIVPAVRTLTINSVDPSSGAAIALSPADNSSQADGSTPLTRQYNLGTTVNLTAASSAGSGNTFLKWLRGGVDYATTRNVSILMDADYVLTAVYAVPPPPPPTATSARIVAESSFEATWTGVSGATSYVLEVATDNAFNSHVTGYDTKDVGSTLRYPVSGLMPGTLYYYRIYAANAGGRSRASSAITVRTYVTGYSVTGVSIPFPSHAALTEYKADEYQLVGIPGDSRKDIGSFLSGSHKQDWQVYWDNGKAGQPADYYMEYQQGAPNFTTSAGRAFWILHKDNLSLAGLASPASLDTAAGTVTIPLTPGQLWNLITNPFNVAISWQGVINANGLTSSTALYQFQQQWSQSAVLDPYVGYLFANADGKSALKIPYHLTVPGAVSKAASNVEEEGGWKVDIAVRSGDFEDRTSWFGVRPQAAVGKDSYEQYKPRHLAWVSDVYFDRPEWDSRYPEFATDVRPPATTEAMQIWDLVLRADNKTNPVQIEFSGLSAVPGRLTIYLLDETSGRSVDLRKEACYVFTPAVAKMKLQVLVGKEEEVKEKVASALPRSFALLPNYPNPFNPSTTIPVVVPVKGQVSVIVYNVLGQKVKTLFHGSMESGISYLKWAGDREGGLPLASGTYFVELRAGTASRMVRPIMLLR